MESNGDGQTGTPQGDDYSFPVCEVAPYDLVIESADPVVPTATQQNIGPKSDRNTTYEGGGKNRRPLQVSIVRDDELGSFEKKTVAFGRWGLVIAFLSLFAASAAAYFIFQQFEEMADQTEFLGRGARQARIDSNESGKATAEQLKILRGQLTQQQNAMLLDQRAWVGIQGTIPTPPDQTGQIGITFREINTGKTPALNVRGRIEIDPLPLESRPDFPADFSDSFLIPSGSKSVIPPNVWQDATTWSRTGHDLADAGTKRAAFYFHGRIVYDDVFGGHHWVVFCYQWVDPDPNLSNRREWVGCSSHNQIDDAQSFRQAQKPN